MARRRETEGELDRRLRAALEPRPVQVGRVVEEALGGRGVRRVRRLALAAGALVASTVILVGVLLAPGPRRDRSPATLTAPRYTLTNRGGVVVVRGLDGRTEFVGSGSRPSEPPPRMMLIVQGGTRP